MKLQELLFGDRCAHVPPDDSCVYLGSQERDASSVSPEVEEGGLVAEKTELVTIASPIDAVQLAGCSGQQTQTTQAQPEPMQ